MAYRGSVIRLPIGLQGFSGSRNPTQLQAGHFAEVDNVNIDGGLIQKDGGAAKMNASAVGAPSAIISGYNYSPLASGTRDVVFLADGSIMKDSGAGTFPTTLASGLNVSRDPPPRFVMGGGESTGLPRTLFCFSGVNQVRAVDADGAVMATITTPAADWTGAGNFPTFGILHEGRMWAGGNASDPHRMYYSRLTDHQDYSSPGGSLGIYPGEGERIVGAVSFRGLLIVFKYPKGVYTINTQDPSPFGWRVDPLSRGVGAVSQHLIVPIDNDVLYMDSGGNTHMLSATNAFGGVMTSNISQKNDMAEFMRAGTDITRLIRCAGIWYSTKQKAIFGIKSLSGSDIDTLLTIDFSDPEVGPRWFKSIRDEPFSIWLRPDVSGVYKPVHGDDAGFVWLMDQDARNKDGVAYRMFFESANTDLSFADPTLAVKDKNGDFLELIFEPQGDWDLAVQVYWDDVPGPPLLYSMGGAGAALGVFVLGTDALASTAIRSIRKRIAGSGKRIRLTADNQGLDQNVALSGIYLSFRAAGERNKS